MSIQEIKHWFEVAVPTPNKDTQRVQLGVHLEEISEMFETLSETSIEHHNNTALKATNQSIHMLAEKMKKDPTFSLNILDKKALLDALCDQIVTTIGVAHMYDFDILGAIKEVSRSNNSKFVDGKAIFNENGKIIKGPDYTKPDLDPYL